MVNISNITKIGDVHVGDISAGTVKYLKDNHVIYKDEKLKEHLISLEDAMEAVFGDGWDEDHPNGSYMKKEIEQLHKALGKKDCAYLRIVYL